MADVGIVLRERAADGISASAADVTWSYCEIHNGRANALLRICLYYGAPAEVSAAGALALLAVTGLIVG